MTLTLTLTLTLTKVDRAYAAMEGAAGRKGGRGALHGKQARIASYSLVIASRGPRSYVGVHAATHNLSNTPSEAGAPHQKASAQLTRRETRL